MQIHKSEAAHSRAIEQNNILSLSHQLVEQTSTRETNASRRSAYSLGKLSYNNIIFRKDNKIIQQALPYFPNQFNYKIFLIHKKEREDQVRNFCKDSKRKEKEVGAYYLNNWISDEKCPCLQPQEGAAYLAFLIINLQFNKAEEILSSLPKSLQLSMLRNILSKFKNLVTLIRISDPQIQNLFLGRREFSIPTLEQSQEQKYMNLFPSSSSKKFFDTNVKEKSCYINQNLNFLTDFSKRIEKQRIQNDYYRLIFYFLGNKQDQRQTGSFIKILIQCKTMKLTDRLNFAHKLLTIEQRNYFIPGLQQQLCKLPYLQNLYFYEDKEKQIKQIFQNYLDEYGDLETIAFLARSYNYPMLMQYIENYRQVLKLSFEAYELNKLDNFTTKKSQAVQPYVNLYDSSFFSRIKVHEEKISDPQPNIENKRKCIICFQTENKTQSYLECAKCQHGGHLSHMIAWFQKHQNCPKIDCPCICN